MCARETRDCKSTFGHPAVGRGTSLFATDEVCVSVTYRGASPYDVLDFRVAKAMSEASVRRLPDGKYRATTPSLDHFYDDGPTRKAALAELHEDARWLLADPVRITFTAKGRDLVAEVLAERFGGYSASVPELPGCCTCGDTMEEVRAYLVEAAEGWLEAQDVFASCKRE